MLRQGRVEEGVWREIEQGYEGYLKSKSNVLSVQFQRENIHAIYRRREWVVLGLEELAHREGISAQAHCGRCTHHLCLVHRLLYSDLPMEDASEAMSRKERAEEMSIVSAWSSV